MKKPISQISIAIVCALLGFLLAYQFKIIIKSSTEEIPLTNDELLSEVESVKKQNQELLASNNTLLEKVKKYEDSASNSGEVGTEVQRELNNSRMMLGLDDVKGSGVIIEINLKAAMFDTNSLSLIKDEDLSYIVNALAFSSAEAISINDIRITPQTGIKVSGSFIRVGASERIRPENSIVIKAIGNSTEMKKAIEFQGFLETVVGSSYTTEVKVADEIKVGKTTQTLVNDYMKLEEN